MMTVRLGSVPGGTYFMSLEIKGPTQLTIHHGQSVLSGGPRLFASCRPPGASSEPHFANVEPGPGKLVRLTRLRERQGPELH